MRRSPGADCEPGRVASLFADGEAIRFQEGFDSDFGLGDELSIVLPVAR